LSAADVSTGCVEPQPRRAGGGLVEWLLLRRALAEARARLPEGGAEGRELLRRGTLALELADRTLDASPPLEAGEAPFLALELYRIASYFHLAASARGERPGDLRAAWDASPEELRLLAAGGAERLRAIAAIVLEGRLGDDAALPVGEQRRRAEEVRRFDHALARSLEDPDAAVSRIFVQRALRIALVLLATIALGVGAVLLRARLVVPVDLAEGRPVRTSSVWSDFDPIAHTVLRGTVGVEFHTNEEDDPWAEIDLGAVQRIGSAAIKNRADCCIDRAIPLVMEVSTDQQKFTEVARRTDAFVTWQPEFSPVNARWIKLHVPRRTWLHLERVSIYAAP
jgi:hypothetical protein